MRNISGYNPVTDHPLIDLLGTNVNGASFITIDTATPVRLTGGKLNPHQGRVTKHVFGSSVMVFQNKRTNAYENMVFRRLEQEGKDPSSFQLSPRAWGTRMEGRPFVTHKDQLYLEVIFLKCGMVDYYLDNPLHGRSQIKKEDIIGLQDHEEAHQGGLDNKVIIRTYNCDNIRRIVINKQEYII